MKRNEIDKVFTQKVAEYIANGYIINSSTMSGHQGEEGKVDLVKGNELIRVWMNRETEGWSSKKDTFHGYKMVIRVGRWNVSAANINSWTTIWMKDLETLEEITYYALSDTYYVDNREEAMGAQQKRYNRYGNKKYHYEFNLSNEEAVAIASGYLKRSVGYKRVSHDEIHVKRYMSNDMNHSSYGIVYRGTKYNLQ